VCDEHLWNVSVLQSIPFQSCNITVPSMHQSSELSLFFRTSIQNFVCMSHFSMHATYPNHLMFLEYIVLIIVGEENKLQSTSLCSFSTYLSLLPSQIQIFSSAPCSQTPSLCVFPLMCGTKFHTYTKQHVHKIRFIYIYFFKLVERFYYYSFGVGDAGSAWPASWLTGWR
jgi:hypothetical protein